MSATGAGSGTVEVVRSRLAAVRHAIAQVTDREVCVVCVTKTHGDDVVAAALSAGLVDLGENYAQELRERSVPPTGVQPRWHFIGQLQTNKVRLVADRVWCWQSVDRHSLVAELARRVPGARVMVQVDLADRPGRGGCAAGEVPGLVRTAVDAGLDVVGLMGVGPPGPAEEARPAFRRLVGLAEDLGLPERSIGMSGDYLVAVEEGSTMVRLGSVLLGSRRG